MGLPVENLNIYRYQISDIILRSAEWEKPYIIEKETIASLAILNDYGNTLAPQISLECEVTYEVYYEILAKKDIRALFTITKSNIGTNSDVTNVTKKSEIYGTRVYSCDFKVHDQGYLHSMDVVESKIDINKEHIVNNITKKIKLFLYDPEKLLNAKKNLSVILSGSKNDLVNYILSKRNISNCIITPIPIDHGTYAIPYGSLKDNIDFINDNLFLS